MDLMCILNIPFPFSIYSHWMKVHFNTHRNYIWSMKSYLKQLPCYTHNDAEGLLSYFLTFDYLKAWILAGLGWIGSLCSFRSKAMVDLGSQIVSKLQHLLGSQRIQMVPGWREPASQPPFRLLPPLSPTTIPLPTQNSKSEIWVRRLEQWLCRNEPWALTGR